MSHARILRWFAFPLFLAMSWGARAYAEDDPSSASKYFRAGTAAYESGDSRAAATAFEQAYRLAPRGPAIYNAALAWQLAGEDARAADAFAMASKSADLDAAKLATAQAELARLERRVGRVDVDGPKGALVSIAHAAKLPLPAHVHVSPGRHILLAERASGSSFSQAVNVAAGAVAHVVVPAVELGRPSTFVADAGTSASTWRTLGWVLVGAGALSAGLATYFGVRTLGARDDYAATDYTNESDYDRAFALRTATNVAWLTSAVLALGGAASLVVGATRPASPARPRPRPERAKAGKADWGWSF
jgi:hypothetical protein